MVTLPETSKPTPFAIMRNVHEALRASIVTQRRWLDAGDVKALAGEWSDFSRALAVHMAMEDEAMFPLLEEVDRDAMTTAKLSDEHVEDVRLAAEVSAALAATPIDTVVLGAAWSAWADDHLHHLAHEEEVMMPLTAKTAPTPEGRARVVHDRLLSLAARRPDFDWFIGWVTRTLNGSVSDATPANAALVGFVRGLRLACSPTEWERLRPIVQRNCSEDV